MILNSVLLLLALFSPVSSFVVGTTSNTFINTNTPGSDSALKMTSSTSTKPEIQVVHQPDEAFLKEKGVFSWGTWGCDAGSFPWTYGENESCYLLQGQVTVTPTDGRQPATFGKGDFVTFPAGMSCQWDVTEAVHKHFLFF
mmetsp:Transcript_6168/g.12691  ORF Transcript_6168/g.12691 Transcript_6168/m.12691 type:complete len:141 (-) Transcript_6168:48-470(-)|eukprot:CAMPEP_0168733438 /NCGR_PEP_ID=MMETSP0724-20121128/8292_1 /TAXON_ID=265536 /ORGANISM="Amphiprora sp., Strain CCMP467" /LENGTH=140 /DNA_ID=CAMNT_0008780499 /DNA_START=141 /DNA_END=563 /DNA_ORIENTATION=-